MSSVFGAIIMYILIWTIECGLLIIIILGIAISLMCSRRKISDHRGSDEGEDSILNLREIDYFPRWERNVDYRDETGYWRLVAAAPMGFREFSLIPLGITIKDHEIIFALPGVYSSQAAHRLRWIRPRDEVQLNAVHHDFIGWRNATVVYRVDGQVLCQYKYHNSIYQYWTHLNDAYEIRQKQSSDVVPFEIRQNQNQSSLFSKYDIPPCIIDIIWTFKEQMECCERKRKLHADFIHNYVDNTQLCSNRHVVNGSSPSIACNGICFWTNISGSRCCECTTSNRWSDNIFAHNSI